METADIMLCLGGDTGNTVPKFGVTASEIAVLRHIHGEEAVFDVRPLDTALNISQREERERLRERYGRMEGDRRISPAVEALFPGAASPMFTRIADLGLPEEFFKAEKRLRARETEPEEEASGAMSAEPAKPPARSRKAAAKKVEKEAIVAVKAAEKLSPDDENYGAGANEPAASEEAAEDDGIGEMGDGQNENLFA